MDFRAQGIVMETKNDDAVATQDREPRGLPDEKALEFLRTEHLNRGHGSIDKIQSDLRCGEIQGPHIPSQQFSRLKQGWRCATCLRNLQTHGPSRRKAAPKPKMDMRILEEVIVDPVGPRRVPSVVVTGERGNQKAGGNTYVIVGMDAKTERLVLAFAKDKEAGTLTPKLREMRRDLEMLAKQSGEYDGKNKIKLQAWVSDRDSAFTSDVAVAEMMSKRIYHKMAASGARNHTPLLDAKIRRLLDKVRVVLDDSGLGPEYFELAAKHCADIINMEINYPVGVLLQSK